MKTVDCINYIASKNVFMNTIVLSVRREQTEALMPKDMWH